MLFYVFLLFLRKQENNKNKTTNNRSTMKTNKIKKYNKNKQ